MDAERNGGITIEGADRRDVLIRACIQTVGASQTAAQTAARNIRLETGSTVRAVSADGDSNYAVSYEIFVPRQTALNLRTHNGGIGVSNVEGAIQFAAYNGGISLKNLAGDVKGSTKNGGVRVNLAGDGWRGAGLDVQTVNGGVYLSMPESYRARIETGTVNGGFSSELAALKPESETRYRNNKLSADLNGGGAPIRVVTRNGGVKISVLD